MTVSITLFKMKGNKLLNMSLVTTTGLTGPVPNNTHFGNTFSENLFRLYIKTSMYKYLLVLWGIDEGS